MTTLSSYVIQQRGSLSVPEAVVETFVRALSARDESTHEHALRVQRFALALADEAGIEDERLIDAIKAAALLHDIGKLAIPDRLLNKPGPLTADEFDQVKEHVTIGADMLAAVPVPTALTLIVRHHHENWDGSGYPDGLAGEGIPVGARVLAIVDCYDALTSDRPYRRALSHGSAIAMIHERSGSMYEPAMVDAFLRIVHQLRSGSDRKRTSRTHVGSREPWRLQARIV
jgi:putative nucleotidyltransferase with HDIG domain